MEGSHRHVVATRLPRLLSRLSFVEMGRVSNFLVRRHWDIFKVVFPTSVGFGFLYTFTYGTSPLADAKSYLLGQTHIVKNSDPHCLFAGSSSQADVLTVRFTSSSLGSSR